ncbi:MAG: glycosyltransferase [Parvularculaceae bacterium]
MERINEKMPQISVVIPTLNAGRGLAEALAALVPAALDGLVREVIVADGGGSTDETLAIAR